MFVWVLLALILVSIGVIGVYKAMSVKPAPTGPKHNYEIIRHTFNDGTKLFYAAYRVPGTEMLGRSGEDEFFYIGTESINHRFTKTEFATRDLAFEACQKHFGALLKHEEIVEKLFISA